MLGTKVTTSSHYPHVPAYIQPFPSSLPPEDVEYLIMKGVFDLPDVRLRNELLVTFVRNVYPYLPLLDLRVFLKAIEDDGKSSRVSLLLFHAVMFSSAAFIDPTNRHILKKESRQAFYEKAKMLYNFDTETDPIVLIQTTLLLTYWYEAPDDPKDARYWLEIGISIATSIGLHCEPDPELPPTLQYLRKRLWWCLYTRDRLVSFTLRQAPIIGIEAEDTIPLPVMEDFPFFDLSHSGGVRVRQSAQYQRQCARIFIQKSKLCIIVSQIIGLARAKSPSARSESADICDMQLDSWYESLPMDVKYCPPTSLDVSEAAKSLLAYQAWLQILFLAAKSLLGRINPSSNARIDLQGTSPPSSQNFADTRIQHTTQAITSIAESLDSTDSIQCLPTTAVALLLPVIKVHILNIRSGHSDRWMAGFRSFHCCLNVLGKLGKTYMIAESVAQFLKLTITGNNSLGCEAVDIRSKTPRLFAEVLTQTELCMLFTIK
ncbi:hypothetical protein FE257_011601 [Aspergillus nanangensis]|uniref:Xylanolytic transcriptional activator regulatory domain-containing protein n=1 Tax=Aspergillus nanangensis TaxID=2582783 RepID=A0AAD4CHC0_ASPNN|nr:hypothetical protein FE257_011601 [Aspergillus nanangensis]